MRNGLNISSVSELVHELRNKPTEARVYYQAHVALGPDRLSARALTTRAGSIRIARDFAIQGARAVPAANNTTDALPTPLEYALAAVGSCGLATFVHGMSAKGATLSSLGLVAEAEHRRGPDGDELANLRYMLDVDADCADDVVAEIARRASLLSPNQRAVLEANELAWRVVVRGAGQALAERAATVGADDVSAGYPDLVEQLRCQLRWRYGMLSAGHVGSSARADNRSVAPVAVDQPKQYFGTDKAASPQEYLLAALGMDLANGLADAADVAPRGVVITLGGCLDLRGQLRVDPAAEVRLHRLTATLELQVNGDPEPWLDRAELVAHRSAVRRLLCHPRTIHIEVRARGTALLSFTQELRTR